MIIIPARLKSTRFPEKIITPINGVPMFVATAKAVSECDDVVVAVDNEKVLQIAKQYSIKAVLTDLNHQSGTDRIRQATEILGLKDDEIIINVQADEPFIETDVIRNFKTFCAKNQNNAFMFSCYKKIDKENVDDLNLVKVVTDKDEYALYFSRSCIPFNRSDLMATYKAHLGIYGYSVKSLNEFCNLSYSTLENLEKLEQLRALENGKKILMLEVSSKSIGIDSKEDLQKALSEFR
ncbi:3-deoxy-manno-octulosonate cytidylyltransferase [Campylobacter pinnipediorum]|uniref:3-deoxy-manno-octulosonate cytidylyltransferase n=1 Tax=Campylobacter pinnipediorum TaxID=1965231 RepID=UPI00084D7B84|nr:3-deoxy-manno-octulosonate cytidylyltransferase [Campylobacter pinnipediorum]AQW80934.1 3-deoxy-D-manno-octulosonate cytidylyltransferase [Campylobacter pinnipediorum subsp. pinnipediorum]AQW84235.1 3-deoxy-D-manno-octulosonate cytidylyltransferase [Campylobacter pinnipediorum subsp. pinnipediorum]